ncbi:hypothetical protein M405DRAFT_885376 [Rhizopogon salebrosus TDB-379]|nr:hypothetical protein M405DRAFT_885376 [Rhizopogon salebrosus TDB-379]
MAAHPFNFFNNESYEVPAVHSSEEIFICQWIGPAGGPCNHEFSLQDLSLHLREIHGIRGADSLRVHCAWENCNTELNKESLKRHVKSQHLSIVHPCNTCPRRYTRQYGLNQHQPHCPGLQQ